MMSEVGRLPSTTPDPPPAHTRHYRSFDTFLGREPPLNERRKPAIPTPRQMLATPFDKAQRTFTMFLEALTFVKFFAGLSDRRKREFTSMTGPGASGWLTGLTYSPDRRDREDWEGVAYHIGLRDRLGLPVRLLEDPRLQCACNRADNEFTLDHAFHCNILGKADARHDAIRDVLALHCVLVGWCGPFEEKKGRLGYVREVPVQDLNGAKMDVQCDRYNRTRTLGIDVVVVHPLCDSYRNLPATSLGAAAAAKEAHKHDEWTFYTAGDRRSTHVLKPAAIESRGRLGSSFINIVENLAQSEYVQNQYASMYGLQPRAAIAKYRAQLLQEISSTLARTTYQGLLYDRIRYLRRHQRVRLPPGLPPPLQPPPGLPPPPGPPPSLSLLLPESADD